VSLADPRQAAPVLALRAIARRQLLFLGSLDGLFTMVGQEEKKIRTNPAARTTDLLKKVFGK
jgi:hypothetical protein